MSSISIKIATSVAIIGGIAAAAISASAALNLPTQSCSYAFNTNLKVGSRGTDVMNLQKVLNGWSQTQIAATGAGSPGMETTYFGPATMKAIAKFQTLHLTELGIKAPVANVGPGTRGLLNQACTANGTVSTGTTNTGTTGTVVGTVVSGPVSVALAANQPTGMVINSQSGAQMLNLSFTGNGTVTGLQLQRIGASADTDMTNVYLYDGNTRISDAASVVTGGAINFNNPSGLFSVNGTRVITVRADLSSSIGGRSIGVKLNTVTAGGSVSTYTNIIGNTFQGSSVTPATVNFSAINPTTATVDAGTSQYNVWSGSATVSTRAVNLKAATFKFVGSAPVDSLANINLYVDGSKVAGPLVINAANNNKVTFDLGATPYNLTTGSHSFDVRADIVKGSSRSITMSVENVSDLMFEDSNLTGVNIGTTITNGNQQVALSQGNSVYNTINVNAGSVTVNVDSSFNPSKVTGGASNVPVGQFTLKAYGEDVKINTLALGFSLGTITTLNNVSLYVNGGQVGTNQNYIGSTLNFGSSNLVTIPANTTVTLTVKADIVSTSSAAYTNGTIAVILGPNTNNAQGNNSNQLVSVAGTAITGNSLTITSGAGSFARTSGFTSASVAPNTAGVKIGSFTLQANSAESIKVNSVGVLPQIGGFSASAANTISNYSNLVLKTGTTVLGTPVGNPSSSTSTFSFPDIIIPANGTQTFDVYADIGGNASTTAPTIYTDMSVTSRGVVSNTTIISSATGAAAVTSSISSTLAASSLQSSSPVSQFVVGGSTFGIATFRLSTASAGTVATVREMRFGTAGQDAIQSITVGGVTSTVLGSGVSATTTVSGLSIVVGSTGTDVPVTVKYSGFQNTVGGGSLLASVPTTGITLSYTEAVSGSGSVITNYTQVPSNPMTLVASKPTVTVSSGGTDSLNLGALSKIGEFTVSADANGKIAVASTSISISTIGVTSPELATSTLVLKDGGTTIPNVSLVVNNTGTASTTPVFTFTTPYEIAAGSSKTFSIYGTINGQAQQGIVPRVNTSLTSGATFKWVDVIGANTSETGAYIYNFPTNSYTSKTN